MAAGVSWLLDPRFLSPLGLWGRSAGWFLFTAGDSGCWGRPALLRCLPGTLCLSRLFWCSVYTDSKIFSVGGTTVS